MDQIHNESCQSGRGNKKLKPEFSRINGGGSISDISICSFDFDMSSTENGILQMKSQIYIQFLTTRSMCNKEERINLM